MIVTFAPKHCAQGSHIKKEDIPQYTGNPVLSPFGFRILIANAASDGDKLVVYDKSNAFQHVILPLAQRTKYITLAPLMLAWYRERFPHLAIPKNDGSGYLVQLCTQFQGNHDAGLEWYVLLRDVLIKEAGFVQCIEEPGILRLDKFGERMRIGISTDDALAAVSGTKIEAYVDGVLHNYFEVKKNTGDTLYFLNIRLIQSEHGISVDQTEQIKTMLSKFFSKDEKVNPTADYWDTSLDEEMYNGTILEGAELKRIEKEYNGGIRHHVGCLQHFNNYTRMDLMYACNRMSSFAVIPTTAALQQIKKIMRCLAGCPHRPLFYRRGVDLQAKTLLQQEVSVGEYRSLEVSNHIAAFGDGSERKSIYDNRTICSYIITMGSVAVDWRAVTSQSMSTCSTDSELKTYYMTAKVLTVTRPVQNFLGNPIDTPIPIYEDSQPTINIVKSRNPTNRIRHIAAYAAYAHEEYLNERSEPIYCPTAIQLADIGTKNVPRPQRFRLHCHIMGYKFYPAPDTKHYILLDLDSFKEPFRSNFD